MSVSNKNGSGRRAFLKAIGTGASLGAVGVVSGTGDNTVTIPYAMRGDEVVVTKDVPADWYNHLQRAEEVSSQLQTLYGDSPEIESVGVTFADQTVSDMRVAEIEVEVDSAKLTDTLPTSQNGVNIKTTEALEAGPSGCLNKGWFDPILEGVKMATPQNWGTCCCRVKKNGTYYMLYPFGGGYAAYAMYKYGGFRFYT